MLGNPEYHLSVAFSLPWLNLVLTWVLYSPQWWRTVLAGVKAEQSLASQGLRGRLRHEENSGGGG